MKTAQVGETLSSTNLPNLIANDTIYKGSIYAKSSVRIEGRFEGVIKCAEKVFTGIKSIIEADIEALAIQLSGRLKGKLQARNRVSIGAESSFEGVIETATLEVAEGAKLNGQIIMNREV
ncbi:MAG: polymer-forming cytoskeletal protein [Chitinophagales bacterium]